MMKRQREQDEFDLSEAESSNSSSGSQSVSESEPSDVEDIKAANHAALKTAKKRKRALSPSAFGGALSQLLDLPAPSEKTVAKLHSKPLQTPQQLEELQKQKELKALRATRHQKEERGHVPDVIGGWTARPAKPWNEWNGAKDDKAMAKGKMPAMLGGGEAEKALRRLAQKGVVKLFNAIKAAQETTEEQSAKPKMAKIAAMAAKAQAEGKAPEIKAPNLLGSKGKEQALANMSKETFLQILKSQSQTASA